MFTVVAVDNIDHIPSSTTAKGSFHGTAISLMQHAKSVGKNRLLSISVQKVGRNLCVYPSLILALMQSY